MRFSLQQCEARLDELDRSLMDPSVATNPDRLREITKERAHLEPMVRIWKDLDRARKELKEAKELLSDPETREDEEMVEITELEIDELKEKIPALELELRSALIPPDPFEGRDIILEIRAGTGGDEAALFAADLFRMYVRFCESNRWKVDILSSSHISVGGAGKTSVGYKEVICQISGGEAYKYFRHESGVHRVQRVPRTESQGRVHTSASTVAIMPIAEAVEVNIQNKDLRIDVFRASGAGGQHVNTTDSAVRITHIPTGTVVSCQDEKSQHKNKAKAMKVLAARILERQQQEAHAEAAETRRVQVGSGDRSERIRTYNFPQNRITDHRINLTLYKLDRFIEGDLLEMVDALNAHLQEQKITDMGADLSV
ncbi:MAG: peptide chain release factor 1 [Proteobacteria bacterium]|nr:peptide chain release factor 1 [Pseudomonadota bacterium]